MYILETISFVVLPINIINPKGWQELVVYTVKTTEKK